MTARKGPPVGDDALGAAAALASSRHTPEDHAAAIRRKANLQLSALIAPAAARADKFSRIGGSKTAGRISVAAPIPVLKNQYCCFSIS